MSTRSGKRIHGSIHENAVYDVLEVKSERKMRGKRLKENCNEIASEKKRKHYVRYPSDEELAAANNTEKLLRSLRKSQRNALEEHNIVATDSEASNDDRAARHTRRTRKTEATDNTENIEPSKEVETKVKGKNNKKNKILSEENSLEPVLKTIKKKSNKKKKRKSGSLIVEDIPQTYDGKNNLSNMSIDSFHSAAGSPIKVCNELKNLEDNVKVLDVPSQSTRSHDKVLESVETNHHIEDMPSKATRSKIHSVKNIGLEDVELKTKKKKDIKCKRKVTNENACKNSLTKTTNDEDASNSSKVDIIEPIFPTTDSNETQDKNSDSFNNSVALNNSLKNFNKKRRSKRYDNLLTFEIESVNNVKTPDKLQKLATTKESSTKKNSTYDKINVSETNLNATFDKESSNNSINQNGQPQGILTKTTKNSLKKKKKSTFDRINVSETNILNTTFDKEISNECVNQIDHSENDLNNGNSHKKKRNSTYNKTNGDTATNLNETEITNVPNNHSKHSCYDKINFSETSLNVTIDEEMPENPINESGESQNVITNGIKNSDTKKRKSSIRKSISNKIDASIIHLDATFEKDDSNLIEQKVPNNTQEKELKKSRLSKFSLDQDVSSNLNATYDKSTISDSQPSSRKNSTFFDKTDNINTTFEMVKSIKLDATFDKCQNNDKTRRGSSLISSDNTNNVSSETSKDISRISITSDESMADNIVNVTPVLIESSIDESQINISPFEPHMSIKNAETKNTTLPLKQQKGFKNNRDDTLEGTNTEKISKTPPKSEEKVTEIKTSKTPLKREGTYTEIKYSTPPKYEGMFTENIGTTTPKGKDTETKNPNTPICGGTYSELKTAITPMKREGTYTELNPTATPLKKDVIENKNATPLLKREGTFTKDSDVPESPKVQPNINKTPTRRKSLPSPGRTPFPVSKSASKEEEKCEKSILNVTRSIEKSRRRSSIADLLPRATKVMFCSPVDTPIVVGQMKGKLIKSNLKGSDKSFVFDDSVSHAIRPPRKRSYTQSEAEAISSKRKRLTTGQQQSVERLSRHRSTSASGNLQDPGTPSKRVSTAKKSKPEVTPSKSKLEGRVSRTKLPNFAALHQKQFAKMESLDECQERKAKRARQLLTPTGSINVLERISPKETQPSPTATEPQPQPKKDMPKNSIIPPEHKGYTRFGFKLNMDVNPFSFPSKTETKPKTNQESRIKALKRQATRPSLAGATNSRKEVAKQTVLREKSFTEKRDTKRVENRTVIKGVRTNRRFELQMKMRNVN